MADSQEKGKFRADIPDDAVADALRSVERVGRAGAPAEGEAAADPVPVEVEGAAAGADPATAQL
jgi:molecular chaperone GrpE